MIPSLIEISSEAAGSSLNLRSDGPSMAPGSARRAGMSREPWLGSSVTPDPHREAGRELRSAGQTGGLPHLPSEPMRSFCYALLMIR
jgi:hypothetical protein